MVKTSDDLMDIHPMERMEQLRSISREKKGSIASKKKELEELEQAKKKEIAEIEQKKARELEELESKKKKNIAEIEAKKKELEELEQKKVQEIEETEELIEKSFQDLMRHKRKIMLDEEELKKDKNSLLEDITGTAPKNNINTNYGNIIEQLRQPTSIYEITNRGFYSSLTELRNRAANGEITAEEERFIDQLRGRFENLEEQTTYIQEKDRNDYVKRSLNIIDQIDNYKSKR